MANLLRRRRAPARVPRVLTAAAQRIRADDPTETRRAKKRRQDWQDLAWRYYDELGEVKYSTNLIANTLSKLSLFVALPADDPEADPERVNDENVQELLEPLATPGSGHAHLLRDIGINYTIPGECYLIGRDAASDDGEFVDQTDQAWSVRSIDEIRMQGERWSLYDADTRESVELGAGDYVARLWRPHARRYEVADAPLRGVLSSCEQILILEQEIRATSRSRLSVGGILVVASEMSFGSTDPATANAGDGEATDNPFLADLMESLVTPIGDEGSASAVVPHVLEVPGEMVDKIKFVPFRRDRDQFLDKELERAIRRLAQGLNVPVEVVIGMEDVNHWCVDEETEALTIHGWRRVDDLVRGTLIRALDHETGLACWTPIQDLYQSDVENEPMIAIDAKSHSSLTTPNHRWPVIDRDGRRTWTTSETIREQDRIPTAAPSLDTPADAKWSDAFVELVAWFWTEGHVQGNNIKIAQSHTRNSERVALIRAALTTLYGPSSESLRGSRQPAWREFIQPNTSSYGGAVTVFYLNALAAQPLLDVAPAKRVTPEFVCNLTAGQLALFIDRSLQGDGWHYASGRRDIFARDRDMLAALELAGVLAGYTTTIRATPGGWRLNLASKATLRPVKAARAAKRADSQDGIRVAPATYTGRIWCPVTAHGTWLARRRGTVYYTGNTAWQIEESTFKAHVEPLALEILHSLTVGYLRPTLQAAGISDAERMFIWYDASRLFAKPTRTQDAKDAHTAVAISDKALRDVLHFSDEDAPDDDEIARRIVTRRGAVDAEIMLMLLRLAMPELAERIETQPAEDTPLLPPAEEPPPRPTPPEEGPPPAVDAPPPEPQTPSLAAAATSERSRLGQRLADIDDRLRTRLEVAADAALRRALERAGAKLRTKLRRDEHAREAIRDAAAHEIAARLGPALVAQAGLPDEELEDALADPEPRFERWAAAAQQEALDAIGIEGDARADVERELEEDRRSAWTWLAAALLTLARKRLFDPSPDAPLEGEFDETLAVPPGLIREALARAGGTKDITRLADWAALSESGTRPLGGVATGDRLLGLIGRQGGGVEGYEWDYGAFPRTRSFDPHLALDGVIFENFDDPRLTNSNAFPPVAFYLPGDHAGCQCNLVPVIVAPQIFPEPVIA